MLVVNLFGAPGAGKSTGAAYIFAELKLRGINVEIVTEFAKDKVYEETKEVWNNQVYIFGKQYFRISRVDGKVDVVITDAPLLASAYYNNSVLLGEDFNKLVLRIFNSYDNMNFFVNRTKAYNPSGRFQTEERSNEMAEELHNFLNESDVEYEDIFGERASYNYVITKIIEKLKLFKEKV